jgi:NhaA family Na+:H+ antiporter
VTTNKAPFPKPLGTAVATFGAVVRPIQAFFQLQAASGILLFAAAVVALVWANSAYHSYEALVSTPILLGLGEHARRFTIHDLVNEVLMAVFFFVVGMEIKRELVAGELSTVRKALLPGIAAVGGMLVPSAMFLVFNLGKPSQAGWGIPMATDIAFAIGCLTVLGKRVPQALTIFVMALAIFDDIGGIIVIALFYGRGLDLAWLLGGGLLTVVLFTMSRAYVRSGLAYTLVGAGLWYTLHAGGIHATISGVVLGLMIPARPRRGARSVLRDLEGHTRKLLSAAGDEEIDSACILQVEEELEDMEPPLQRFIHALHPWVAFAIMPGFALANSGVYLRGMTAADVAGPVSLGIGVGLALGKPLGIMGATALAVKLGFGDRPGGAGWAPILGVSIVAGIGFTVALFIAALAFPQAPGLLAQAKVGIMLGSLLAGLAGVTVLRLTTRAPERTGG